MGFTPKVTGLYIQCRFEQTVKSLFITPCVSAKTIYTFWFIPNSLCKDCPSVAFTYKGLILCTLIGTKGLQLSLDLTCMNPKNLGKHPTSHRHTHLSHTHTHNPDMDGHTNRSALNETANCVWLKRRQRGLPWQSLPRLRASSYRLPLHQSPVAKDTFHSKSTILTHIVCYCMRYPNLSRLTSFRCWCYYMINRIHMTEISRKIIKALYGNGEQNSVFRRSCGLICTKQQCMAMICMTAFDIEKIFTATWKENGHPRGSI